MKNRIAKFSDIGKVKIYEEELRKTKKGEVLVKLKAVGICGSDVHYFLEGGLGSFKLPFPMSVGHEPAGEVVESTVKKFKKGDRVAIEPANPCKACFWCKKKKFNLCDKGQFMAASGQGAIADYIIVDAGQLVKIPNNMSYEEGALMEPIGVGFQAYNLTKPSAKSSVTIFGAGPIGLCLMAVLRKKGIKTIYMVDVLPYRVAFAKKMGATNAFLYKNAVEEIKKITKNKGTEYVYDAAGTQDAINGSIAVVSPGGTIGAIGIPTTDFVSYNPHKLRTKEVTIQNVRRSNELLSASLRLFRNDKHIKKLVTHAFFLEDTQKAFDLVSTYGNGVIKCVIKSN